MAFIKKIWKDRLSEYPTRRILTKSDNSTELVTVARSEGEISQEGDSFSASNMNDLEERIESEFGVVNNKLCCDFSNEITRSFLTAIGDTPTYTATEDCYVRFVTNAFSTGTSSTSRAQSFGWINNMIVVSASSGDANVKGYCFVGHSPIRIKAGDVIKVSGYTESGYIIYGCR